jgi:hypothetical protein
MPNSGDERYSKRLVKKLDPVNVMAGKIKPPLNAETKPMAKPKAPAPAKDAKPLKSTTGATPKPVVKKGAAAKAKKGC